MALYRKQLIILPKVDKIEVLERSLNLNGRTVFSMLSNSTMMLSSSMN